MFAIIETGGKQYRVEVGSVLDIEKLPVGDAVTFDRVLAYIDDSGKSTLGAPYVNGVKVVANRVLDGKADKIIVSTYKRRKKYRRKQGHRQLFTRVEIKEISL